MRILIVDDEPLIMQYITRCVHMADSEIEIVGSVTSGVKALKLLEKEHVDVVFADITMPKMDGIELLRRIKKNYPDTKVIMLTCHADFAYVRAAMQNNAEDYILKDEISAELVRTALQRIQDSEKEKAAENVEKALQRRNYIRKLIENNASIPQIDVSELRSHGIYLKDSAFVVMLFWNDEENIQYIQKKERDILENMLFYAYNENGMFLIANVKEEIFRKIHGGTEAYVRSFESNIHGLVSCSRVNHYVSQLPNAISEAIENQAQLFYGIRTTRAEQETGIVLLEQCIMRSTVQIADKNWEAGCKELEKLLETVKNHHPQVILFKTLVIQLLCSLQDKLKLDFGNVEASLRDSRSFSEAERYIQSCVNILKQQGIQYSPSIRRAVEYIQAHYTEDISLNTVAEMVYLHRDYLSRQFKKEVGINYSEYLLKIRLDKAKKLLETTDMRISDVASSVGISNLSYFSTVFNKTYGLKPKEIRKKNFDESCQNYKKTHQI